ncbi:hypothetical protein CGLO_15846 [Colletotrichum gloeosporioides Cg-14]|uniref:Uncharacterized protein n=1 Tax=Colletotrichum gloeosporioides (strain Cg-14) TaxID=1237896 RepID=T0L176_COLGC|nr:hypothetical protein CGLO_15846 [Colletotrichum gloeosporioides Cg-14]
MECQGADDSSRYLTDKPEYENPRWIRRVDSTWGCHWRCEERYLDGLEGQATPIHMLLLPFLLSSKGLYLDFIRFISQPTQYVHFTDLETIDMTLSTTVPQPPSKLPETVSSREVKQYHLFESLRNVDLTLRLPMSVINTLFIHYFSYHDETKMLPRPGGTPEGSGRQREHDQWMRIWPNLLGMHHLQRLTLWLDHDKAFDWEQVAETQILQGLSDIMPALKSQKVDVTVNLPRLTPRKRNARTAKDVFVDSAAAFQIQRRTRLPWAIRLLNENWSGADEEKDRVAWATNEENAQPPPDIPLEYCFSPFDDFEENIMKQLGYDVYSRAYQNHPVLGAQDNPNWG